MNDNGHPIIGLAESYSSSILRKNNQGKRVECLGKRGESRWVPFAGDLCSYVDGFSLHAKVRINAIDRKGLEHLCRSSGNCESSLENG
jgi:hypothetical protein